MSKTQRIVENGAEDDSFNTHYDAVVFPKRAFPMFLADHPTVVVVNFFINHNFFAQCGVEFFFNVEIVRRLLPVFGRIIDGMTIPTQRTIWDGNIVFGLIPINCGFPTGG